MRPVVKLQQIVRAMNVWGQDESDRSRYIDDKTSSLTVDILFYNTVQSVHGQFHLLLDRTSAGRFSGEAKVCQGQGSKLTSVAACGNTQFVQLGASHHMQLAVIFADQRVSWTVHC